VILFLAAAAILGCVVLAALGMGGEMAAFPIDSAPLRMDEVTATDVALLRPPLALWGYSVPATEEALGMIARAVTARDTEIATLRQELADMQAQWQHGEHSALAHDEVPAEPANGGVPGPAHDEHPAVPAYGEVPAVPAYGEVRETSAYGEAPETAEYDEVPAWPAPAEPESGE
jgi:hypothetical protein